MKTTTTSIDNMLVKEAIKNGAKVPGAEIKKNTSITIK
ncbi:MAG: siphovirus Gp157 family protein [Bacteroidales bacterium]|nr:siphovirus Gp157 family protein [Bacteroidales bacterium]